jgi:thiol-disulfide isomerase/thioredoxin
MNVRVRAPELPQNYPWLNTEKPLSLKQLKGRVVILDFWTYCCINCLHILSDLKYLEQKYKIKLVNPVSGNCQSVLGDGVVGLQDGQGKNTRFSEPSGLSVMGSNLYIADTNNHVIRCVDLEILRVKTLKFSGLCAPDVCIPPNV